MGEMLSRIVCMNQIENEQEKEMQGVEEIISLQALFIYLCVYVLAYVFSALVLLSSNRLWAHSCKWEG